MKRTDAIVRGLFVVILFVGVTGCNSLQRQKSKPVLDTLPTAITSTRPAQSVEEADSINVNLVDNLGGVASEEFEGTFSTLGKVISRFSTAFPAERNVLNRDTKVIALNQGGKSLYLPWFLAASTVASNIVVESKDSVQILDWEETPLNKKTTTQTELFKRKYFAETKADYDESKGTMLPPTNAMVVTDKVIEGHIKIIEANRQIPNLTDEAKNILAKEKTLATEALEKWNNMFSKSNVTFRIGGLSSNPGGKTVPSLTKIRQGIHGDEKISNNIPANILVISRGNNTFVVPVRSELDNLRIPDNVKSAAENAYQESLIQDNDSFYFSRLRQFAPVNAGLRKQLVAQMDDKLAAIDSQANQRLAQLELQRNTVENRLLPNSEPGWIRKNLRKIPSRLPDFRFSLPQL